ncbi:Long-chain-fatty-acid--CoA ligase FadD13 [Thalassovita gelatinovora]|uniref:3-methylmercaptopropionyl-CoA ligase n=1 Tax=Thalassovita gelatinovora TaxID=53501 RepID=A0A0P1FXU5_THAGE|nr:AMP-binding protein [Thalassovita gelatinovora]QIZ79908.1 long-chain fatty acid--CoA ligase [Thalassovita gelatinovora]CUH66397.1 Long-chain-fatty-acid--CoA ligase FadD13 [Thalassovita gelatinovora]SER14486.1 long-chain acyl-CoA synthetase [Thalassovita gelatinovora]
MNIGCWLERIAQIHPQRPALHLGRDCVADYATFHRKSLQVAAWLHGKGIEPGDRVALFLKNCPDYLIAHYGAWYAGAAVVPINAKLHGREAAWIIENSGAKLSFTSPGLTDALQQAGAAGDIIDIASPAYAGIFQTDSAVSPVPRDPTDLAWLFYTSGTTGRPKGVIINHRMLMTMSLSYLADTDQVRSDDTILYAAPMSHGAGIYNMVHVLMGARHVCPPSGGFEEAEIFDLARHHRNVHMFAAPTMVKRMTQIAKATGETGEGLRSIIYAGGPMYQADIIEAVDHFGPIFVQIYGQGEAPMGITALSRHDVADRSHIRWQERLKSVGRAQSAVEIRIGDEHGCELPHGQAGEIMVRSDIVMPGYWQNPEATDKTIRDGWLLTGDVGFMDEDGYVTMQDRSKDMIISGGTNIYPREVEEALLTHPTVAEVSVVGRPDAEWGEVVVAFVVMATGAEMDQAALDAHCLDQIARFKRPKAYFTLNELPKNNYGKVLKTELRKRLEEM